MKVTLISILILWTGYISCQIQYGTNNYIEYHPGTLPIVISVPHGGFMQPSTIPDRTCNSPTMVTDANTLELASQIDTSLFALTGCHPHVIYCNLKRTKLDCNRNLADGACGNSDAEQAWSEFHQFIETAQATALAEHGERVFYVDLHGHGNPTQRLELGYLLYEDELELADDVLNSSTYVGYSSIQHLVGVNVNGATHVELLRGPESLGTLFADNGFPAVPSQQDPFPGLTSNYFSGGYNTLVHTSYDPGNVVDGVQMECNYSGVRDNYLNRKAFAETFALVFDDYLNLHHSSVLTSNCGILDVTDITGMAGIILYPSVSDGTEELVLKNWELGSADFYITDDKGSVVFSGRVSGDNKISLPVTLTSGYYYLTLGNEKCREQLRFCISK